MRQLATAVLVAFAGGLPLFASAAATSSTIVQQRTSDGSILLTDRPLAGAKTERSWQVYIEDPVAARQRAIDVKAEANLVSERVQRAIEQQRRADLDAERLRLSRLDVDRGSAAYDGDGYGDAVAVFAPTGLGLRGFGHMRSHQGMRGRDGRDGRDGGRLRGGRGSGRFTGPKAL